MTVIHTARLLYMILDHEKFLNIEKLNEALLTVLANSLARVRPWPLSPPRTTPEGWRVLGGPTLDWEIVGRCRRSRRGNTVSNFTGGPETEFFSVWLYFPGRFALQYPR